MEFVENGQLTGEELTIYLREKLNGYDSNNTSSIVLGCTHYPFVTDTIREVVGNNIDVIDGGLGTAREIKRRLEEKNLLRDSNEEGKIDKYDSWSFNEDEMKSINEDRKCNKKGCYRNKNI